MALLNKAYFVQNPLSSTLFVEERVRERRSINSFNLHLLPLTPSSTNNVEEGGYGRVNQI